MGLMLALLLACSALAADQKYDSLFAVNGVIDSGLIAETAILDSAACADVTVSGHTKLGAAEALKVYTYHVGIDANDISNGYVSITVTNWTDTKVRAIMSSGYDVSATNVYYSTDEGVTEFTKAYYDGATTVYLSFGSRFDDTNDKMNLTVIVAE